MLNRERRHLKRALLPLLFALLAPILQACGGPEIEASQARMDEALAVLGSSLAERERDLAAREAALATRVAELAERDAALAARETALERWSREVGQREQGLDARRETLAVREARLGRHEAEVAARQAEMSTAESRLAEERETLAATREDAVRREEAARERERRNPPRVYTEVALTANTLIDVQFQSTVSSATSRVGDTFKTRVAQDVYAHDGRLVVPAGSELRGTVVEAVPLKKIGGRALLGLRFDEIDLPWGKTSELRASLYTEGRNESRRDAKTIGGATAGGAILGRILDKNDRGRGTILGALIGAAAGSAVAANRPGEEVQIPGGAVVTLALDEPAVVMVPWKSRYSDPGEEVPTE